MFGLRLILNVNSGCAELNGKLFHVLGSNFVSFEIGDFENFYFDFTLLYSLRVFEQNLR